ncbi:MAG: polyprenyl synthetase family protein [bacterium]
MSRETATSIRPMKAKEITAPVADDLKAFYRQYAKMLRSGVWMIDKVSAYLVKSRGKGLRPTLTLLAARASGAQGELPEKTLIAALVVEVLHTATLVHDDVVDRATERRGRPTLNLVFNNKVAVLFGDYLLSKSLQGMLAQRSLEVLDLFSDCSIRLAKGELMEAIGARKLNLDKNQYLQMVSDKTASLISAACQMGPLSLGMSSEYVRPLGVFGEMVGIAFQIRDDLLDLGDGSNEIGKPVGIDLSQAKMTMPLIHALEQVSENEKKEVLRQLRRAKRAWKRGKKPNVDDVISLIREKQGIEYSRDIALEYSGKAEKSLDDLPGQNEYVHHLRRFARYAATRNK